MKTLDELYNYTKNLLGKINEINKQIMELTKQRDGLRIQMDEKEKVLKYKIFFEGAAQYKNQHQRELALETEKATDPDFLAIKKQEQEIAYQLKSLYDEREVLYTLTKLNIAYIQAHKGGDV